MQILAHTHIEINIRYQFQFDDEKSISIFIISRSDVLVNERSGASKAIQFTPTQWFASNSIKFEFDVLCKIPMSNSIHGMH